MKIGAFLKDHKIFTAVILTYTLMFVAAESYMKATGSQLEWAGLLFLCPLLIGIAAGMYRSLRIHPEKYTTVRPQLLILSCLVTSGVCMVESLLRLWSAISG
ncbi:MAG: hypothetical protein ACI4O3_06895 [Oscillospiraceae bacterium]